MKIETLCERFIPDDSTKKAGTTAEKIFKILKKENYREIALSFTEEHPDRAVEDEKIHYVFVGMMTAQILLRTINRLARQYDIFEEENEKHN